MNKKLASRFLPMATYLLIWQGLASLVGQAYLLPGPLPVLRKVGLTLLDPNFWARLATTTASWLACLLASFFLAASLSWMGQRWTWLGSFLVGPLHFMRAAPLVAYILLFLLWFERASLVLVLGIFMGLPILYENMVQAWQAVPQDLVEMARSFQVGAWAQYRQIYWPSMRAYVQAGLTIASGLLLKAIIAVEVLGLLPQSLGESLYYAKLYLDLGQLMALTFLIVAWSLVLDGLVKKLLGVGHDPS